MKHTRIVRFAVTGASMSLALALASAGAADAQRTIGGFSRSDQSDVTGPAVTSADQVAALFAEPGSVRSMFCSVAWGVRTATDRVQARLAAARLGPATASDGGYLNSPAQRSVLDLLAGDTRNPDADVAVLAALTANNSARRQASRLISEVRGLFTLLATLDPLHPDEVAATRLSRAVGAYNGFIDASTSEFLGSPPDELTALHEMLGEVVAASLEHEGRPEDPSTVDAAGLACAGIDPVAAAAPPPDVPFEMCVLVDGDFRLVAGLNGAESSDSAVIVDGERRPLAEVYPNARAASSAPWVKVGESVTIEGVAYRPFGLAHFITPGDLVPRGQHQGFEYFAQNDDLADSVIYFVAGPECLVQPYRSAKTIRVRG